MNRAWLMLCMFFMSNYGIVNAATFRTKKPSSRVIRKRELAFLRELEKKEEDRRISRRHYNYVPAEPPRVVRKTSAGTYAQYYAAADMIYETYQKGRFGVPKSDKFSGVSHMTAREYIVGWLADPSPPTRSIAERFFRK